jgi:hypothetical protein
MWGDVDPNTIEFGAMSRWRAELEKNHGRNVAHKTLRESWSRLSEQNLRVDKWSVCRVRLPSGGAAG